MRFIIKPFPRLIIFSESEDKLNDSVPGAGFYCLAILVLTVSLVFLMGFVLFNEVVSTVKNAARLSLMLFVVVCAGLASVGLIGRAKNGLLLVIAMQALLLCSSIVDIQGD